MSTSPIVDRFLALVRGLESSPARVLVCSPAGWDDVRFALDTPAQGIAGDPRVHLFGVPIYLDHDPGAPKWDLVYAEEYYARCTCQTVDLGGLMGLGPFIPYPERTPNPNCPQHRPAEETPKP
jgi:hypothetical protein